MFLNKEDFSGYAPGTIMGMGITTNDLNGAYMTDNDKGRELRYVAVKGYNNDWCIYVKWAETSSYENVINNGDKIHGRDNIMRVVPCEEEVFKLYRK